MQAIEAVLEIPEETHSEYSAAEEPLREPLSSLSVELGRISAEIQSINSGFQAQIQQAFAETQAAMEDAYAAQVQEKMAEARREFEVELQRRVGRFEQVGKEADRVGSLLNSVSEEIARMIDDPTAELSHLIRKKAEQAELKAYLEGLRYALGG